MFTHFLSVGRTGMVSLRVVALIVFSVIAAACSNEGPEVEVATVTVEPETLTVRLLLGQSSTSCRSGFPARLMTAVVRDVNGQIVPINDSGISWTSSNPSIAQRLRSDAYLAAEGVVVGYSMGMATMAATVRGKTGRGAVTVAPRLLDIGPRASPIAVDQGGTLPLTVTALGCGSDSLPTAAAQPRWTSRNPTVLTVDPATGVARGVAPGRATVVATVLGVSDSTSAQVGVRSPYDGRFTGRSSNYGSATLFVLFGNVISFEVNGVSAPLAGGGTCSQTKYWALAAPVFNASFSEGGVSGRFLDARSVSGSFGSTVVGGLCDNGTRTSNSVTVPGGTFTATR